ncbi:hypothetical protein DPMN_014101 [Dreissena polymorpha]|uniref:Integrase core domain-containing protein n=1 Tax=Dreissena polymorpha TaxID=45954 RepID=A0A9D4N8S1_DREPO|nr:hypothetical protein DPMN_014101 [Dreissena polymorpha]
MMFNHECDQNTGLKTLVSELLCSDTEEPIEGLSLLAEACTINALKGRGEPCTGHVHTYLLSFSATWMNLNPFNPIHRWCLHCVYLPRIQRAFDTLREAWNRHRLRTERGMTPTQLFFEGVHRLAGQGHTDSAGLLSPC